MIVRISLDNTNDDTRSKLLGNIIPNIEEMREQRKAELNRKLVRNRTSWQKDFRLKGKGRVVDHTNPLRTTDH